MTGAATPLNSLHAHQLIGDTGMSNLIHRRSGARSGFSIVEMLIALTISAALMTATLAALDASFQQYKSTTESASTHVVSRIVMHRMLSMIRTGVEFGPFPVDVYNNAQNPVVSDFIEFVSERDLTAGRDRITRIELRPGADPNGPGELWYVLINNGASNQPKGGPGPLNPGNTSNSGATIIDQRLLIPGVKGVSFTLRYGKQTGALDLATIDMTIAPNDSKDLRIGAASDPAAPQTIRLVASAAPRQQR